MIFFHCDYGFGWQPWTEIYFNLPFAAVILQPTNPSQKKRENTAQSIKNGINDSIPLLMIMEKVYYHNWNVLNILWNVGLLAQPPVFHFCIHDIDNITIMSFPLLLSL